MKQRKTLWISLLVGVVVIAAVLIAYLLNSGSMEVAQAADNGSVGTAAAEQSDITIYVSGTGSLVPVMTTELKFSESGTLLELLVGIGDWVQEGDVLAYLQTDTDRLELQSQITAAELAVVQAQATYDELIENAEVASAQALLDLEAAQDAYDDVFSQDIEIAAAKQAVAAVEDAVEDAEYDLALLNAKPDQQAIDTAYAALLFKEKSLNEAIDEVETTEFKIRSANDSRTRENLKDRLLRLNLNLANAQLDYEEALAKYESLFADPDPYDVAVVETQLQTAELQLEVAQQVLDELMEGPPAGALLQAEVDLAEAQAVYELTNDGPNTDELTLAESNLANAQAQLAVLQTELSVIELRAPFAGVVTAINFDVNEYVAQKVVMSIADVSQPLVDFYVDQSESANIAVGDEVTLTFDALPGKTYTGTIQSINPALQAINSTRQEIDFADYLGGVILLDDPEIAGALPTGLQVSVEMVGSVIEDALLVPVQAVQTDDNGDTFAYLYDGKSAEIRYVTIGMIEGSNVVIEEGLSVGDVVAIDHFEQLGNQQ